MARPLSETDGVEAAVAHSGRGPSRNAADRHGGRLDQPFAAWRPRRVHGRLSGSSGAGNR